MSHWLLWWGIGLFIAIRHYWTLFVLKLPPANNQIEGMFIVVDAGLWIFSGIMLLTLREQLERALVAIIQFNALSAGQRLATVPLESLNWGCGEVWPGISNEAEKTDKVMQELKETLDKWEPKPKGD